VTGRARKGATSLSGNHDHFDAARLGGIQQTCNFVVASSPTREGRCLQIRQHLCGVFHIPSRKIEGICDALANLGKLAIQLPCLTGVDQVEGGKNVKIGAVKTEQGRAFRAETRRSHGSDGICSIELETLPRRLDWTGSPSVPVLPT
jgi:hypothetical protein